MHPDLQIVFDYFTEVDIAIIGSAAWNYESANDIDVIFLADADFPAIAAQHELTYCGWNRKGVHVRRTLTPLFIHNVLKPVQLSQLSSTREFADHPYETLLRDGTRLHPGKHFDKSTATKQR